MSDLISISLIETPHEEQDWNRRQLSVTVLEPRIRFWTYESAGIVLGCSQSGLVSAVDAARRAGMPLAGRQAGGGAVLVGPWMLSASIVLPNSHPLAQDGAVASYRPIGVAFSAALRGMGIDACTVTPEDLKAAQQFGPKATLPWACYGGLSPWEVVAGGRKIVGLAQVRRRTGVLLAAGLLLQQPDWHLLCRALAKPWPDAERLAQCTTSCAQELGWQPTLSEIAFALRRNLQEALNPPDLRQARHHRRIGGTAPNPLSMHEDNDRAAY